MNSARVKRLVPLVAAGTALTLGLAACGGGDTSGSDGGKPQVVASTNVWGSVVSAVGGDKVDVKSIIDDPSGDPHSYEASAEDAADVQSADAVVYNGGGYDDFFAQLAEEASNPVVAFDLSGKGGEGHEGHEHGEHEGEAAHAEEGHEGHEGHEHGEVNEHVWYDPETVGKVADAVAQRLGEIDSADKQLFTDNAKRFKAELDELSSKATKIGEGGEKKVVATEPVAHYLLEAAGVTDSTPDDFAEAVESETDVPVAAQDEVNRLISAKKVQAVVNNEQTSTSVTQRMVSQAKGAGIPVVNVTETLPGGTKGYIAWMSGEVDELAKALNE